MWDLPHLHQVLLHLLELPHHPGDFFGLTLLPTPSVETLALPLVHFCVNSYHLRLPNIYKFSQRHGAIVDST